MVEQHAERTLRRNTLRRHTTQPVRRTTAGVLLIAVGLAAVLATAGCQGQDNASSVTSQAPNQPVESGAGGLDPGATAATGGANGSGATGGTGGTAGSGSGGGSTAHPTTATPTGPRIEYFRIDQKPKCAEGTAVFHAPAVPLVIAWKLVGAKGAALSVDNPGQVGSYGTYAVQGTETFMFSCGGPVGSIETHTYTIYTTGVEPQQSKTIKVSATVLDDGKPV